MVRYRNYIITYDPPPIPTRACDWQFAHQDFDGASDSGDNRAGSAASLDDAKDQIDDMIETCPTGHPVPCPICGAVNVSQCNGGQYVSPCLRAMPRTERRARRMMRITEVEREMTNGR